MTYSDSLQVILTPTIINNEIWSDRIIKVVKNKETTINISETQVNTINRYLLIPIILRSNVYPQNIPIENLRYTIY